MAQLIWNEIGDRHFEVGIDRGVLFTYDERGVPWNGLISVTESPSGGEPTPYYLDGVKYLNVASRKEFSGTIEAFTYPEEFAEHEGWVILENGLAADEQKSRPFGLSYRTRIGNDVDGYEHGYKIHLIYNALAAPSESSYSTLGTEIDPLNFSWSFTTMTRKATSLGNVNLDPLSHVVIDSTKTNATQMRFIEEWIYGSTTHSPTMPSLGQIFDLFERPLVTLIIQSDPSTGITPLIASESVNGDLRGRLSEGLYVMADNSRLLEKSTPGFFILANPGFYIPEG